MTKRQSEILAYLRRHDQASVQDLIDFLVANNHIKCSKLTVLRDLDQLIRQDALARVGKGRSTRYRAEIDLEEYFSLSPFSRVLKCQTYNFDVLGVFADLESDSQILETAKLNSLYLKKRAELSPTLLRKEIERLTIELAWKSSRIEGNTYSLLDSERLIREDIVAEGKSAEETRMLINHKVALDYVMAEPGHFRTLTASKILKLHSLLTSGLDVSSGFRTMRGAIIGTKYRPLEEYSQIVKAVEQLVSYLEQLTNPLVKALIAVLMISYIQPFEDGNKRTARMIANAILIAANYCPLSYRSVDEVAYKKALLLFYEQNNYKYFKRLFLDQFTDAVNTYF